MNDYLRVLLRIAIIWPLLHLITQMMGKRSINQLPIFNFIVAITLCSIVGADLTAPRVPQGPTIMTIIVIGLVQVGLTWGKVKSAIIRRFTTPTPTLVIL